MNFLLSSLLALFLGMSPMVHNENPLTKLDHLTDGVWKAYNGRFNVELTYRWAPSKRIIMASLQFYSKDGKDLGYHDGCFTWDEKAGKIIYWDLDRDSGLLTKGEATVSDTEFFHRAFLPDGKSYTSKFVFDGKEKMYLIFLTDADGNKREENKTTYIKHQSND